MKFYEVYPECPAGFGGVEWDDNYDQPRQISAHLTFAAPMREALITAYSGAYAVTEPLAEALLETDLTGFEFGPVTSSISSDYDLQRQFEVPPLRGLIITGQRFVDDFAVLFPAPLILSERAVQFLKTCGEPFQGDVWEVLEEDIEDAGN